MKLQLTYSELCEILSKNLGVTVESVEIVSEKSKVAEINIVAHNPLDLTAEQYGFYDGYRLLAKDEVKERLNSYIKIENWDGKYWIKGCRGSYISGTYRTKLSREELAKLS